LETIAAWSDAFSFRNLALLGQDHLNAQQAIRGQIQQRIVAGASAEGDLASVDREIAAADARRSSFERLAGEAEARLAALTGVGAGPGLLRTPLLGPELIGLDLALLRAEQNAQVRSAKRLADAARLEGRAARGDALPRLSVGIEGGRYGILEGTDDHEFRATFRLTQRLSVATKARIDEADGRAGLAQAQYDEAVEQARRDITVAVQDRAALREQLAAAKNAYLSARRARDVVGERFRLNRGSLVDVLQAQDELMENAVAYLRALSEHDAAHYVLLSRTGQLLETLSIAPRGRP
jgi:adhesin transport system outer membrane protein